MLYALGVLCLAVLVGQTLLLVRMQGPPPLPAPTRTAEGTPLELRVTQLELQVKQLPGILEEETKRASRHRDRAQKAEARARALAGESEADDNPSEHLHALDAGGSGPNGMPPLHGNVGAPEPDHIARARAIGYPWNFLGKG